MNRPKYSESDFDLVQIEVCIGTVESSDDGEHSSPRFYIRRSFQFIGDSPSRDQCIKALDRLLQETTALKQRLLESGIKAEHHERS